MVGRCAILYIHMKINISSRILLYFFLILVGLSGLVFTFLLSSPQGFYAAIAAAGIAGFGVAANIYDTKSRNKQLVCPTGSDCNAVVTSRYAKFFGIPLEHLGMAYYAVIVLSYIALIFTPSVFTPAMNLTVIILSALAGLFSIYLLFVQAVILRKWCIWCILSALLSLTIFVFSLVSAEAVVEFIAQFDQVLWVIRSLGLMLGVGGATASAVLFFQFLDDKSIDEKELSAIKGVFELVWVGLGLVIVGQFGLYVAYPEMLAQSGVFQAQMIALVIAIVSGAALMVIYAPFLTYIPFEKLPEDQDASFATLRRPVLTIGATVLVAWYFIFFTDFFSVESITLLLKALLIGLTTAVCIALTWDAYLSQPLGSSGKIKQDKE